MDKKLISIIVPVYNIGQYIEKCIRSILSQSYGNLEIILVDDGSTDDSGIICDQYAMADYRIKVIHKANGGLVSARKAGIRTAQGEYIGFVDGDDYIEEKMYETLAASLEEQQVDFIHSGYIKNEDQQFSVKSHKEYRLNDMKSRERILKEMILDPTNEQSVSSSIWSKLFQGELVRNVYEEIPDNQSYGEDLLFLCHCVMRCDSFSTIPEAYYHYVKREESICNERKIENIQRETGLYEALKKLFEEYGLYPEMQDSLERFYLRSLLACIGHLTNAVCPVYRYSAIEELGGKKIVLYGAGAVGQDYYTQLSRDMRCTVIAVADKHADRYSYDFMRLIPADEIRNLEYDAILIAVLKEGTAKAIRDELSASGVEKEKILWRKPGFAV